MMMPADATKGFLCFLVVFIAGTSAHADDFFEKQVRPLLVQHCLACHGPDKQKAGLRLDTKPGWQHGGQSGTAIIPGKPEMSLFIKAISYTDDKLQMPPKSKLSSSEIAVLTKWVKDGALDPRESGPVQLGGMTLEAARKWWAFQPLSRPAVPRKPANNPIDAFIREKLAQRQLTPSPAADKRTLIRRATYDLTGLPPTMEEIDNFLEDDSPAAFEKVVHRLLASPHYGERWGRHWLDLVRYADTAGENSDHPLPHAWRYRNWVIDAFNRDQPYDEFLREQVAGDILAGQGPPEKYASRIIATGYLALARRFDHDSDKSMHLTHEDGIDTLGKAFLGMTLGCARCHDHKYDPISTRDYYALYGIFESTRFAFPGCEAKQQPRDMVPLLPPQEWDRIVKPYRDKLGAIDVEIRKNQATHAKRLEGLKKAIAPSAQRLSSGEIADGGEQFLEKLPDTIEIKTGEMLLLSVTPLKNHGADTTLLEWEITEVDQQKRKWNVTADVIDDLLAGNPHADRLGNKQVWWFFDMRPGPLLLPEPIAHASGKTGLHVWRNGDTPSLLVNTTPDTITAWTKLPGRSLFVHPAQNGNVAIGWLSPLSGKVRITGRIKDAHPGGTDGVGWIIERLAADLRSDLLALAADNQTRQQLDRQKAELLRQAPRQDVAFAVAEGKPADAHIQLRGDPEKPGEVIHRRWLEVLGATPVASKTGSGRDELANWIASKSNPLTARVMVNRIWLHHFGKGLVKTPNDFGTRGIAPTHPELLDWLASEFIAKGWSVKAMHRTIMLSAAYQQSSISRGDAQTIDPNNDWYWRFDTRRLSAEEIRDSLLVASGQLDRKQAQAHPFPPENTWAYTQHVPFSTFFETNKRSVYLVSIRNRRHPFLGLFDGADPNATTPQRQVTTVPTQALFFLNDPFFHTQAEQVAARALSKPSTDRLQELFRIVLQRCPTDNDSRMAKRFLQRYRETLPQTDDVHSEKLAWSALARLLLASNEFTFVE